MTAALVNRYLCATAVYKKRKVLKSSAATLDHCLEVGADGGHAGDCSGKAACQKGRQSFNARQARECMKVWVDGSISSWSERYQPLD
jgi:hypothetical protein